MAGGGGFPGNQKPPQSEEPRDNRKRQGTYRKSRVTTGRNTGLTRKSRGTNPGRAVAPTPEEPWHQPRKSRGTNPGRAVAPTPEEPRDQLEQKFYVLPLEILRKFFDNVLNNNPSILYGTSWLPGFARVPSLLPSLTTSRPPPSDYLASIAFPWVRVMGYKMNRFPRQFMKFPELLKC